MRRLCILSWLAVCCFFVLAQLNAATGAQDSPGRVVVFVPGILFHATTPDQIRDAQLQYWGKVVDCMRNRTDCRLYTVEFNGPKVNIRTFSDKSSGLAMYTIVFSTEAASDSLVYRAVELDAALKEICRREHRPITLVGHSAGGMVSRIVLQEAIPGVICPTTVDHLITIATPHQGASAADSIGSLKGTRVTSLQTTEPLIQRLNELPLPARVHFTTFVLNGYGLESRKPGKAYTVPNIRSVEKDMPTCLIGGDGVVHCISQNLLLTNAGSKWSAEHGGGISTILVRIPESDDKSQGFFDSLFSSNFLHTSALSSPEFCNKLSLAASGTATDEDYRQWQAESLIQCHVEDLIRKKSSFHEVVDVHVDRLTVEADAVRYRATGTWVSVGKGTEVFSGEIPVRQHPMFGIVAK